MNQVPHWGFHIRKRRELCGYSSQQKFAEAIGAGQNSVSHWERSAEPVSIRDKKVLKKVLDALRLGNEGELVMLHQQSVAIDMSVLDLTELDPDTLSDLQIGIMLTRMGCSGATIHSVVEEWKNRPGVRKKA